MLKWQNPQGHPTKQTDPSQTTHHNIASRENNNEYEVRFCTLT